MKFRELIRFIILMSSAKPQLAWQLVLKEIRRRIYSNELWYGFHFDLEREFKLPEPEILFAIRELAARDVPVLLNLRQTRINERDFRDVVIRLLCIETHLPTCYVGVTREDHSCCLCWLIRPASNQWLLKRGFHPLQPSEVLLENIWTHRDFRGKRLMKHLTLGLFEKARREGARRAIAYIREGNEPSLVGARAIGWELFILMRVRHRMFRRRTTFEPVFS